MLPATILWGASFPLTIAAPFDSPIIRSASLRQARGSDTDVGRAINALNTAGALAGAVLLTLVGIPRFGSQIAQQALVVAAALTAPPCCCRYAAQPPCSP